MSIVLYCDAEGMEKINVDGGIDIQPLLTERFVILDACILFPAILPKDRRNVQTIEKYSKKLNPEWVYSFVGRRDAEKINRRRIEIVDSIEDGEFQKKGYYFGVTDTVFGELYGLEKGCREENVKEWFNSVKSGVYQIYLPLAGFRARYKPLSDKLNDDGDFSVAMASYFLGCPLASDDYWSFDPSIMNIFRDMYRERWGMKRKFVGHDSVSLLMLLNTSKP